MTRTWRPLVVAALLNLTAGAAIAAAQTVYVRNARPGDAVEVVLNGATAATGQADADGEAKLAIDLSKIGKTEMDASVLLDSCDNARRVILSDRGTTPPPVAPGGNCTRRDVAGVFWVRPINTLVVNFSTDANPSLLLVVGDYTPRDIARSESPEKLPKRNAPTGLALYTGAAYATYSDAPSIACGNVGNCSANGSGIGFTVGGTYWITRFIGVDGAYFRPRKMTAKGSDTGYSFTNTLTTDVVTIMGKLGASAGIVRVYGQGGIDYHQATSATSETIDAKTVTVDGVEVTVPGGTQNFELKTDGWRYVFGGGMEIWAKPKFAFYGEANYAKLKGSRVGGGPEGNINDALTYFIGGIRLRVGGGSTTTTTK
jgi:hypothetical protein